MIRFAIPLLLFLNFGSDIAAQPLIQWQKTFGGSYFDEATSIIQTQDGGYAIAGHTASNNGDVSGNHGAHDLWVIKLSGTGVFQWKKIFGGSDSDDSFTIIQNQKGGFIIVGATLSNDGDVSGNHGGYGIDCWVVELDSSGNLQWQKVLGGSGWDEAATVVATNDGGYIIGGRSDTPDGDVTENHGKLDCWVVKLNAQGNVQWQRSYGGSEDDDIISIVQTSDGGYALAAETWSYDGQVTFNHGNVDFWVIRTDSIGQIIWEHSYGGYNADVPSAIIQTADGGFAVSGYTGSAPSGNVSYNHGAFDYWVIRLDSNGNLLWQKSLGGSKPDWGRGMIQCTDENFLIIGTTTSVDGDLPDTTGGADVWLVKLSQSGELLWQKKYGGSMADNGADIIQTSDGGYIFCGYTWSNDGDVTSTPHGYNDYWIVKLAPETASSVSAPAPTGLLNCYPNPARDRAWVEIPAGDALTDITLAGIDGRVQQELKGNFSRELDLGALPGGVYLVSAIGESGRVYRGKLEVIR